MSLSADAANVEAAYKAGDAWYSAMTAIWESDPRNPSPAVPADVKELEDAYKAAFDRCSDAGQTLIVWSLFDQPLPGDLAARIEGGERFSTEEMLSELTSVSEREAATEWEEACAEQAALPLEIPQDRTCTVCKEQFLSYKGIARWLCDMCFKHTMDHHHRCDYTRENCCCMSVMVYAATVVTLN